MLIAIHYEFLLIGHLLSPVTAQRERFGSGLGWNRRYSSIDRFLTILFAHRLLTTKKIEG